MNKVLFSGFLCALFVCSACRKHTTNVTCADAPITVNGEGFPRPDTLVDVVKYKPDNKFDSVIDSVQLTHFSFDTVYWPALQAITLVPGYDFSIVLVGTQTVYRLSNIKHGSHYHEQMENGTGNTCFNPVISYSLNDSGIRVADTTKTRGPLRLTLYR